MISVLNRYVPGRIFLLIVAENALIAASVCGVTWLRIGHKHGVSALDPVSLQVGIAIALICQLTFYYFDLYNLCSITSNRALIGKLLSACGMCCLLLAACCVIFPALRMRSGVMEETFTYVVFLVLGARLSLEWINRRITVGERVLIVGSGEAARSLARDIQRRSDLSLLLFGYLAESEDSEPIPGVERLGTVEELTSVLQAQNSPPDRIVIAASGPALPLPIDLLLRYRFRGVRIEEAATLSEKLTGRIPIETIPSSMLMFSEGFSRNDTMERLVARGLTVLLSACLLLLCLPLMLLVAVLVRIESKGPVFFRQERVGRDGMVFNILKFRSMFVDAESSSGPQWAKVNDPRVTRVGAVIRKLRIDELPQLVNVLRGDMNLVGPRPERPYFVDLLKQQVPFYDLRHAVCPGLTGWAQVSFPYGASIEDVKRKLEFDLFYVKHASLALDCAVLFRTVRTVMLGEGR